MKRCTPIDKSQLAHFTYLPDVNNQYDLHENAVRIFFGDNRNVLLPTEAFTHSPNNSPGEKGSERMRWCAHTVRVLVKRTVGSVSCSTWQEKTITSEGDKFISRLQGRTSTMTDFIHWILEGICMACVIDAVRNRSSVDASPDELSVRSDMRLTRSTKSD